MAKLLGAVFSAWLFMTAVAHAQTTDAAIIGRVTDTAQVALAGVTVTARHAATGVESQVTTNAAGRFAFLQLPLGGPYVITARRLGFLAQSRSGYELTLGRRVEVAFALTPAPTALATVVVEGTATETRAATFGGNARIGERELEALPAVNRNFTDLAALAPTSGVQSSLLGQRWTSTDIRIDGAQARNMLRAGEFGAGVFSLSLEAIREFEVATSVYDVSQGRQGGGSIRAATKSGTNEWQGSVFSYYRGSGISAPTDYQGRSRAQREFNAVQWGGSVSGPLVRDKAHVFLAFDRQDSSEPLFTGLLRTPSDEIINGVSRDSVARLLTILGTTYGTDTTRAQLGRLDRQPVANAFFGRLDWMLNPRHRLTLTENVTSWNSPLSGGVDLPIALFEARSNYRSLEQQAVATLQSTLPSGLQNTLTVSVSTSRRDLEPNANVPRGFVRIQSTLADGSRGDTRVQFGGNRLAPDNSREYEWQLIDRAYVQRGNVLYAFGTDNTLTQLTTTIAEAQSGVFEFQSLGDLELRRPFRYSRTVPLAEARPTTRQRVLELGAFAQAEWRPAPRVTATVGLRWDGTAFLTAPPRNALVEAVLGERTDRAPRDWTNFQPRGQLVWDVGGRGRDLVRVGAGRFIAQPLYYLHHNQLLNDGTRIADITRSGAAVPVPDYTAYRNDPTTVPGLATGTAPPPYVNLVTADFQMPSVWKASASYRRQVTSRVMVTGTLLGSRTTDNYVYRDRNLREQASFTLDNEAGRAVFVPVGTIDAQGRTLHLNARADTNLGRVLQLTNAGRARQWAAIAEATVLLTSNVRIDGSYTYNRAEDNTTFGCCLGRTSTTFTAVASDPRDLRGTWGASDTDFRHKLVVSGTARTWWGVQAGARYVGASGRPISAVVNGDINGDESGSNDLAFVFDPADPSTPADVAAAMRRVLENPNNLARHYLRDHVGRMAARNGVALPMSHRLDLRLTKRLPTVRGQHVELGVDIFNLGNLLNPKWGAEYQLPLGISNQNPVVQRLPLLNVVGFDAATRRYRYTVNENFGVLPRGGNPYQVQVSVRWGV